MLLISAPEDKGRGTPRAWVFAAVGAVVAAVLALGATDSPAEEEPRLLEPVQQTQEASEGRYGPGYRGRLP